MTLKDYLNRNMKIRALLIGNDTVEPSLKGVKKDINDFKTYLCSYVGGAWKDHEIEIILNSSRSHILSKIKECHDCDFLLILVAAHGAYIVSTNKTIFSSSKTEFIDISELNANCKRQVIIVDICREKISTIPFEEKYIIKKAEKIDSPQIYREKYLELLSETSKGLLEFYSCSIGQSAREDSNGGIYTQSLLQIGRNFGRTFNLYEIHNAVVTTIIEERKIEQIPYVDIGNRRDFPPFAIHLYR